MMRMLFVVATCLLVCSMGQVDHEQLIENIRDAAEADIQKAEAHTAELNARAAAEEKVLSDNKQFAQEAIARGSEDVQTLDKMENQEHKGIEDSKEIESLSTSEPLYINAEKEMSAVDHDAESLSENIQSEGEEVDHSFKSLKKDLEDANVPRKAKLAMQTKKVLGASQDPTETNFKHNFEPANNAMSFKEKIRKAESEANELVEKAEKQESEAEQQEKDTRIELNSLSDEAKTSYKQLTQSEARLEHDLASHKDLDLEKDIADKEADVEANSKKAKLGEAKSSSLQAAVVAAEAQADSEAEAEQGVAPMSSAGTDGSEPADSDSTNSAEAEQGVTPMSTDGSEPDDSDSTNADTNQDGSDSEETPVDGSDQSPDGAAPRAQQRRSVRPMSTAANDGISADLSAIDDDAMQLEQFQKNAVKEIEAIKKPLS